MRRPILLAVPLILVLAVALAGALPARAGEIELRYLGNEGFLISAGETKVLVDALYGDGLDGYPVVPSGVRRRAEAAAGEFSGVDVVLASHRHADHFDAPAVARHLAANPGALFASSEEAARLLREHAPELAEQRIRGFWPAEGERATFETEGIRVSAIRMHHGRAPAQNVGFLVEIGGLSLLHVGDSEVSPEEVGSLPLAEDEVDVLMVPFWYLSSAQRRPALEALGARHVVAMHLPAADAPPEYFGRAGSLEGLVSALEEARPDAWIPRATLEARTFRAAVSPEAR